MSRKAIENALKKFNFNFDKTVDYLLDRKDQKTTNVPVKPAPKPPVKQPVEKTKVPAQRKTSMVSSKVGNKEMDEPLIIERKQSRKMSKEIMFEKPLDKSTWNKLYPIIEYSR